MASKRKSSGRSKADPQDRKSSVRGWAVGAAVLGGAVAGIAALLRRKAAGEVRRAEGHKAPDLTAKAGPPGSQRAPAAFRPDPTAVPTAEEKEALRPATGPSPSLVADRGELNSQTGAGSAREDIAVARAPS